jgi:hypothetical protein
LCLPSDYLIQRLCRLAKEAPNLGDLPAAFVNVPEAPDAARPLVEYLCESLRGSGATRNEYITRAQAVEEELKLPETCATRPALGKGDTFPFEERRVLAATVAALVADDMDAAKAIVTRHSGSVWGGRGESQAQWGLVEAGLRLVEACDDATCESPPPAAPSRGLRHPRPRVTAAAQPRCGAGSTSASSKWRNSTTLSGTPAPACEPD